MAMFAAAIPEADSQIPTLEMARTKAQVHPNRVYASDFCLTGNSTRGIQAAIDSAAVRYERTGERQEVYFGKGEYVLGTIYLKSGVTLMLDSGAVLLGSTNPLDYAKDSICRLKAFIFAVNQHDIGIEGKGVIDGRGFEVANNAVQMVHLGLLQDPLKYDRCNESNRPQNVHFRGCKNVVIRGITLKDPACWCQEYDRCRNLTIENIKVDAKCYWNNDGLDVVDCQNVVIRNCDIDASDDAYCFKSHSVDGVSENVVVENCRGRSSANGIKFGTMTRGTFRHFRFKNIEIYDTYRSGITIASVDGAHIEDVVVDSLKCRNVGNPFFIRFSERRKGTVEPCLKDIVIRNVMANVPLVKADRGYRYEGPVEDMPRNISPASIVGTHGHRIENVLIENVWLLYPGHGDSTFAYRGTSPQALADIPEWEKRYPEFSMWKELPAWGLYVRHADGVTLRNVRMEAGDADYRPAIVADDVNGMIFKDVRIDDNLADGHKYQAVCNNCTKVSTRPLRTKTQKAKVAVSPREELTSDQILAQDNTSPCTAEGKQLYRASLFGCKSDGTTLNTNSIQFAIDYIAQAGGGTLVFEVGRYLTGTIHLKKGVNIQLNEGARIIPSANYWDVDHDEEGSPQLIIDESGGTSQICGLGEVEEI